jgi:cell division protein FtsL
MKFFRLSTLVFLLTAVLSGTVLFVISQRVQRVQHSLAALKEERVKEQDSLHVLHAEWDYLNRPDRLEALATQYLGMKTPELRTVTTDPRALNEPVEPLDVDVKHPVKPALRVQQAVYRPVAPHVPQPAAPTPDEQHSFQDLINNLNDGGGQ